MMPATSISPSCPSNSTLTACDYGSRFLGCCLSALSANDVCGAGCPASSIQPASFEKQFYTQVTEGSCSSPQGKWYTCPDTSPPFFGCCSVNACEQGCPVEALVGAMLSENQAQKEAYASLVQGPMSDAISSSRSEPARPETATTSLSVTTSTSAASATTSTAAPSSSPPTTVLIGGIIGGVVGGILLSAAIAALIIFYRRRRRNGRHSQLQDNTELSTTHLTPMYTSQVNRSHSHHGLPPDTIKHELPSSQAPVRELASLEIPAPVYELPSPVPSPRLNVKTKTSTSTLGREREGNGGVSPMVRPYTPDTPGAVSEISVLEVGTRRDT